VYPDDIEGNYEVLITVTDDDGGTVQRAYTADVLNLPPELAVSGAAMAAEGQLVTISGTFTDPSFYNPLDPGGPREEAYSFMINWGDGTPAESGTPSSVMAGSPGVPTAGSFSRGHHHADDGAYTITVSLDDGDGGVVERMHA